MTRRENNNFELENKVRANMQAIFEDVGIQIDTHDGYEKLCGFLESINVKRELRNRATFFYHKELHAQENKRIEITLGEFCRAKYAMYYTVVTPFTGHGWSTRKMRDVTLSSEGKCSTNLLKLMRFIKRMTAPSPHNCNEPEAALVLVCTSPYIDLKEPSYKQAKGNNRWLKQNEIGK